MKHRWGTYSNLLSLMLFAVLLSACINDDEDNVTDTALVKVGDKVPDFVLSGTDGKVVTSSSLDKRTYILNFFDTGCPDCQQELQVLQRIYDKYNDLVPLLNVPRSQTREEIQHYWEQTGLTMPYYIPKDKDLYYRFATKTIPRTYVISPTGKVTAAFSDSPTADFETLDSLLYQDFLNGSTEDIALFP